MPRIGKQPSPSRARDRARHEDEILAAAERLFARKGYAAATMAEVSAEAGFAIGTLYNLFGSKDAILERLLERHLSSISREMALAMAKEGTPRAKLAASALSRAAYLGANRDFFLLYVNEIPGAQVSVPSGHDVVTVGVQDQLSRLEAVFNELGPSPLDAATRALIFYGATRAYFVERILKARKPPKMREIACVVDVILDGLANGRA